MYFSILFISFVVLMHVKLCVNTRKRVYLVRSSERNAYHRSNRLLPAYFKLKMQNRTRVLRKRKISNDGELHLDVHSYDSLEGPKRRKRAFDSAFNRYLASEHAYRTYNYSNPVEREWLDKYHKALDEVKFNETIALNQLWEKYRHRYDDPKDASDYERMKLIWEQFKQHYKVDEVKPLIKLIRTRRALATVKVTSKIKNNTVTTATVATTPQKPVLKTTPKNPTA